MVPQHPFPPPQPHFYHQSQPSAFMPSTPVSHQLDRKLLTMFIHQYFIF